MTSHFMRIDPGVPDLGNDPLPVSPYLCQDFFEGEREHIFGELWLNVARGCEIPAPGDFIVRPVEIRNASVIVVRGQDGVIRAFHNACSHRSAKVEWRTCGNTRRFSCPYHAWSYDTQGKLRGVPDEENFPGLDKANNALTPIACDTWNDLIFINFDQTPKQSLREYLGTLTEYADDYPMSDFDAWIGVDVGIVNCNWKIFLDAFQEVYHLNALHRQTLGDTFKWRENPDGEPAYFKTFGPHRTISLGYNADHCNGPMGTLAQRFAADITSTAGAAISKARHSLDNRRTGLNPGGMANWAIDVTTLFPNVVWLMGSDSSIFHRVWPIDKNHTRYENVSFYRKPKTASGRFAREVSFGLFRDTIVEDILNTEFNQQALLSGTKKTFHLHSGVSLAVIRPFICLFFNCWPWGLVPKSFEALEPFVDEWALPTSDERLLKRMNTAMGEIQIFYDAMLPIVERALNYLDGFTLGDMPAAETRLYHLVLASAEAALAVEIYHAPRLPLAPIDSRFKVTHVHMG